MFDYPIAWWVWPLLWVVVVVGLVLTLAVADAIVNYVQQKRFDLSLKNAARWHYNKYKGSR